MDEGEESIPQSLSGEAGADEEDRKIVRTADNRSRKDKKTKVEKEEEGKLEIFAIDQGLS